MATTLQVKDKSVSIMMQGGSFLYGQIPEGELKKKLTDSAVFAGKKGYEIGAGVGKKGYEIGAGVGKKGYEIGTGVGGAVYNRAKTVTGAVGSYVTSKTGNSTDAKKPQNVEDGELPVVPNPNVQLNDNEERKEETKNAKS